MKEDLLMKKLLCITIALVLLIASFAGCSSSSKTGDSSTPAGTSSGSAGSSSGSSLGSSTGSSSTEKTGKAPGEMPIVDEPYTLRIFFQQEPQVLDYEDNKLTKFLEEKTGIKIQWDLVTSKDKTQKMNLILATGQDLPDVFMGGMDTSLLIEYAAQGVFVPLNQYIENSSLWFKEVMAEFPELEGIMTAPDGNIYALPSINLSEPNMMASRMWINKVWLDKLGLDVPKTTEELKAVLKAFKENDPNGNGKADEIPLMGATTGWNTGVETYIMNSFLQYPGHTIRYTLNNSKIDAPYVKEEYKEGLKYLNELVKEGLLDKSSFTQDNAQMKQIFENPDVAIVGCVTSGGPNAHANMSSPRYRDYVVVPPLKGPKGVQYTQYNPYQYVNQANCYVITSACKNPEAAFRFADVMYSQEVSMFTRLGEPGTDWIPNPEGKTAVDGGPALFEAILVYGSDQKSHWQNRNPYYNFFDNKGVRTDDPFELQAYLWDAMLQYKPYVPAVETCMPPLINTLEEAEELNKLNTILNQFIDETRVKFITEGNIDEKWQSYINELENIGYKKVIEIYQAAYDRFREKVNF